MFIFVSNLKNNSMKNSNFKNDECMGDFDENGDAVNNAPTKRFNYFYLGIPITKKRFESAVPSVWENHLNEYSEFHYGGFRAVQT